MLLTSIAKSRLPFDISHMAKLIKLFITCSITSFLFLNGNTQIIQHKFQVVKDNAINFVCYNLDMNKDVCTNPTIILIQHLSTHVCDKADFRSKVSQAIIVILQHLPVNKTKEVIKWFHGFIQTPKAQNRTFSLEVFSLFLKSSEKILCQVPSSEVSKTEYSIVEAMLGRCSDKSFNVRTKALNILSQNMKQMLTIIKNKCDAEKSSADDTLDIVCDITPSTHPFSRRIEKITSLLLKRVNDSKVNTRRNALLALEQLVLFDHSLCDDNLHVFQEAGIDVNVLIRKQSITSLSNLLENYNGEIDEIWLITVLPLTLDPEISVQAKCLDLMEREFLHNLISTNLTHYTRACRLLNRLTASDLIALNRYLHKAFSKWSKEKKLRYDMAAKIESQISNSPEPGLFLLYSIIVDKVGTVQPNFILTHWENFIDGNNFCKSIAKYLCEAILHVCNKLPESKRFLIYTKLKEKIESFDLSIELIPLTVEILKKISDIRKTSDEFSNFCVEIMKNCVSSLEQVLVKASVLSEEKIQAYLLTLGELYQLQPNQVTDKGILVLKSFSLSLSGSHSTIITSSVKASAFVTLGKVCMQNCSLAEKIIPTLAKELFISHYPQIQICIVTIMVDILSRYASLIDSYIPMICDCLKHKCHLLRRQTLILLIKLLQEDYVKLHKTLLFQILVTLVDENKMIRQLAEYSLSCTICKIKQDIYCENLVNCIFVLNDFAPPMKKELASILKGMKLFVLNGYQSKPKRLTIYKFMLKHMHLTSPSSVVQDLCSNVLNCIAEDKFPMCGSMGAVLNDCFAILCLEEIRFFTPDVPEDTEETEESENTPKNNLQSLKLTIIEPIIPIVISLKNYFEKKKSNLIDDVRLFLREILKDFTRAELKEILSGDKELAMQIEQELSNPQTPRKSSDCELEQVYNDQETFSISEESPEKLEASSSQSIGSVNQSSSEIEAASRQILQNETLTDTEHSQEQNISCQSPSKSKKIKEFSSVGTQCDNVASSVHKKINRKTKNISKVKKVINLSPKNKTIAKNQQKISKVRLKAPQNKDCPKNRKRISLKIQIRNSIKVLSNKLVSEDFRLSKDIIDCRKLQPHVILSKLKP